MLRLDVLNAFLTGHFQRMGLSECNPILRQGASLLSTLPELSRFSQSYEPSNIYFTSTLQKRKFKFYEAVCPSSHRSRKQSQDSGQES